MTTVLRYFLSYNRIPLIFFTLFGFFFNLFYNTNILAIDENLTQLKKAHFLTKHGNISRQWFDNAMTVLNCTLGLGLSIFHAMAMSSILFNAKYRIMGVLVHLLRVRNIICPLITVLLEIAVFRKSGAYSNGKTSHACHIQAFPTVVFGLFAVVLYASYDKYLAEVRTIYDYLTLNLRCTRGLSPLEEETYICEAMNMHACRETLRMEQKKKLEVDMKAMLAIEKEREKQERDARLKAEAALDSKIRLYQNVGDSIAKSIILYLKTVFGFRSMKPDQENIPPNIRQGLEKHREAMKLTTTQTGMCCASPPVSMNLKNMDYNCDLRKLPQSRQDPCHSMNLQKELEKQRNLREKDLREFEKASKICEQDKEKAKKDKEACEKAEKAKKEACEKEKKEKEAAKKLKEKLDKTKKEVEQKCLDDMESTEFDEDDPCNNIFNELPRADILTNCDMIRTTLPPDCVSMCSGSSIGQGCSNMSMRRTPINLCKSQNTNNSSYANNTGVTSASGSDKGRSTCVRAIPVQITCTDTHNRVRSSSVGSSSSGSTIMTSVPPPKTRPTSQARLSTSKAIQMSNMRRKCRETGNLSKPMPSPTYGKSGTSSPKRNNDDNCTSNNNCNTPVVIKTTITGCKDPEKCAKMNTSKGCACTPERPASSSECPPEINKRPLAKCKATFDVQLSCASKCNLDGTGCTGRCSTGVGAAQTAAEEAAKSLSSSRSPSRKRARTIPPMVKSSSPAVSCNSVDLSSSSEYMTEPLPQPVHRSAVTKNKADVCSPSAVSVNLSHHSNPSSHSNNEANKGHNSSVSEACMVPNSGLKNNNVTRTSNTTTKGGRNKLTETKREVMKCVTNINEDDKKICKETDTIIEEILQSSSNPGETKTMREVTVSRNTIEQPNRIIREESHNTREEIVNFEVSEDVNQDGLSRIADEYRNRKDRMSLLRDQGDAVCELAESDKEIESDQQSVAGSVAESSAQSECSRQSRSDQPAKTTGMRKRSGSETTIVSRTVSCPITANTRAASSPSGKVYKPPYSNIEVPYPTYLEELKRELARRFPNEQLNQPQSSAASSVSSEPADPNPNYAVYRQYVHHNPRQMCPTYGPPPKKKPDITRYYKRKQGMGYPTDIQHGALIRELKAKLSKMQTQDDIEKTLEKIDVLETEELLEQLETLNESPEKPSCSKKSTPTRYYNRKQKMGYPTDIQYGALIRELKSAIKKRDAPPEVVEAITKIDDINQEIENELQERTEEYQSKSQRKMSSSYPEHFLFAAVIKELKKKLKQRNEQDCRQEDAEEALQDYEDSPELRQQRLQTLKHELEARKEKLGLVGVSSGDEVSQISAYRQTINELCPSYAYSSSISSLKSASSEENENAEEVYQSDGMASESEPTLPSTHESSEEQLEPLPPVQPSRVRMVEFEDDRSPSHHSLRYEEEEPQTYAPRSANMTWPLPTSRLPKISGKRLAQDLSMIRDMVARGKQDGRSPKLITVKARPMSRHSNASSSCRINQNTTPKYSKSFPEGTRIRPTTPTNPMAAMSRPGTPKPQPAPSYTSQRYQGSVRSGGIQKPAAAASSQPTRIPAPRTGHIHQNPFSTYARMASNLANTSQRLGMNRPNVMPSSSARPVATQQGAPIPQQQQQHQYQQQAPQRQQVNSYATYAYKQPARSSQQQQQSARCVMPRGKSSANRQG